MKDQFIPAEHALALEKLGFKEKCLTIFQEPICHQTEWQIRSIIKTTYLVITSITKDSFLGYINGNIDSQIKSVAAPLYQQAFDWFRINHDMHSFLRWNEKYKPISWEWVIETRNSGETECRKGWTYEEARLSCLERLIDLQTHG